MTLDDLRTEFENILKRRDLTTTERDRWIAQSIIRASRALRLSKQMEKTATVTISGVTYTSEGLAIPSDLKKLVALTNSQGVQLIRQDISTVLNAALTSDYPTMFIQRAGYWLLGPTPNADDTVREDYIYDPFSALSAGSDTNWLSINAPYIIINGALVLAAPKFKDPRKDGWTAEWRSEIDEVNQESWDDDLSGATMAPAYTFPADDAWG